MFKYQREIIIDRPVEEVFQLISDVDRYDEWSDLKETQLMTKGDLRQGSKMKTTIQRGPFKQQLVFELAEFEPGRTVRWKTSSKSALEWDGGFSVEAQPDNTTRVVSAGKIKLSGLIKYVEPFMMEEFRGEAKELIKLKELMEQA